MVGYRGSECFAANCVCTVSQVMRTYREASVVTDTLAELSVLLSFARVWDATTYKAKQHTVAQLRRDMQLLRYA